METKIDVIISEVRATGNRREKSACRNQSTVVAELDAVLQPKYHRIPRAVLFAL
jgi:hypothetical protein